ncbi:MAG: hypothetical protein JO181_22710 [Solirubrobacterales bacterium]|nr:hypothetical protein [Solirubrobacterales bacterium]
MLAYVFWHQPRVGVARADYERRLRAFHTALSARSASFRLDALPFGAGDGYEDWYLVEDWADLGALNAAAVSAGRRASHDSVAGIAGEGWGGVYAPIRGAGEPPSTTRWLNKPGGESYDAFLDSVRAPTVWQRQMLLGPAPEFCLVESGGLSEVTVRTPIHP